MKKIPPNIYFHISRAADLLEVEVSDLLLMGSTRAIHLGVILEDVPSVLASHLNTGDDGEGNKTIARPRNSDFYLIDPSLYEGQEREVNGVKYNTGLACGMWHLNSGTLHSILRDGSARIGPFLTASHFSVDEDDDSDLLLLGYAHDFDLPKEFFKDLEETKRKIKFQDEEVISVDNLYISRGWLLRIKDCTENCTAITPRNQPKPNVISKGVVKAQEHGNAKRFSQNRENCLMALLYTRKTFPDECKNAHGIDTNDAWAGATIDHWVSVGAGYPQPSADLLKRIIADMERLPKDRTTAGKPKVSPSKK